jgi:hypothetical protein
MGLWSKPAEIIDGHSKLLNLPFLEFGMGAIDRRIENIDKDAVASRFVISVRLPEVSGISIRHHLQVPWRKRLANNFLRL